MKKIFYTILACTLIFAGCRETVLNKETGTLFFNIDCSDELSDKNINVKSDAPLVDTDEFEITINSASGAYVRSFLYRDAPSMLELAAGKYTVSAHSPLLSGGKASWDAPEYACTKNVEILVGKILNIDLNCTLSNMKVSIDCSDKFLNELSDFEITVSEANSSLTWLRDEVIAMKSGYFPVSPLSVFIKGTRALDNSTATLDFKIDKVAPKDHHVIHIDATTTGNATFQLTVDTSTNDKDVDVLVPGFPENPLPEEPENPGTDPEEPGEAGAPSIEWAANPDFAVMEIVAGMNVDLVVKAPGKIKSFKVTVSENFAEIVNGILSAENGVMDLIGNEALCQSLESVGINLPHGDQLLDQTEVSFSLSELVPLIAETSEESGDYTFTLDVEDALGQTLHKVCNFHLTK